jgi:hypothetical protein
MLDFLQGLAYGLLVSCMPWFMAGMLDPRLALPEEVAKRWQVILRYAFVAPFIGVLLFLTSLWGGFGASLGGWLAGLAAVPVELFLERRWRRWRAGRAEHERRAARQRELARQAGERRERHLATLDPARPPAGADEVVLGLWDAKRQLVELQRPDLAVQADRLYTRYRHAIEVLGQKFDAREVTFERAHGLVAEVCRGAVDSLDAMVSLARGSAGIDAEFVRRRLAREGAALGAAEREALRHRLALADDSERRLAELGAGNEAALTALDDVVVAVARIETGRPQAGIATEQALQELRRFAERAGLYGRKA